jgi:hypothetical protein
MLQWSFQPLILYRYTLFQRPSEKSRFISSLTRFMVDISWYIHSWFFRFFLSQPRFENHPNRGKTPRRWKIVSFHRIQHGPRVSIGIAKRKYRCGYMTFEITNMFSVNDYTPLKMNYYWLCKNYTKSEYRYRSNYVRAQHVTWGIMRLNPPHTHIATSEDWTTKWPGTSMAKQQNTEIDPMLKDQRDITPDWPASWRTSPVATLRIDHRIPHTVTVVRNVQFPYFKMRCVLFFVTCRHSRRRSNATVTHIYIYMLYTHTVYICPLDEIWIFTDL